MHTDEVCEVCGEQLELYDICYYPIMVGARCPNGCMDKKENTEEIKNE